jgi:plasmid replication initiation protein
MLKEAIDAINENNGQKKNYYFMPLKEYKRLMGQDDNYKAIYIRQEIKELMTKIIEWNLDEYGHGTSSVMLAGFEIETIENNTVLRWAFSPFLIDKLLKEGYTPLKLSIILDFQSKYSLALYENIQMRKSFNKTSFNLHEFRALMGVEDHEYAQMTNFKAKVLKPALDEINKKSDLLLTCKDLKTGAKIIGFEFSWQNLTVEDIRKREDKQTKIKGYRNSLKDNYGTKIKTGNKWYTLTENGFVRNGKVLGGFDIVDSYEQYKKLEKGGLIQTILPPKI